MGADFNRSRQSRRGSVAVMMAFAIVTLLIFAALAIDLTYVRTTQFELRNAADAAAHASLVELRRSGNESYSTALGQQIAELNEAGGEPVTIEAAAFTYGEWDYAEASFNSGSVFTNAVRVRADRNDGEVDGPIRLLVGPLFGRDDVGAQATAIGAFRSRDVMLTLDVTGSFIEEMNDANKAVTAFLDTMYTRRLPNDRIGLNTFTGGSSMVTTIREVEGNYTAIRGVWYGDGKSNVSSTKASGLTNCYQTTCQVSKSFCGTAMYKKVIKGSWMQSCNAMGDDGKAGFTSQGPGIRVARQHLDGNDTYGNTKVIVLISDGRPTCPGYDNAENNPCASARAAYAVTQADAASASGINIFTVSMNTNKSSAQEAFMASLVRGYGKAYNTAKSSDLDDILTEIAQSIPIALVE
jgi:hypothetical protein